MLTHRYTGCIAHVGAETAPRCLPAGPAGLTARFAGLRFVDREGTARKLFALEPLNGRFGRLGLGHLDEPKAFGTARVAVGNDIDLVHRAIRLKKLAEILLSGGIRQIANKDIHGVFPMGNGMNDRQVIRTVCRSTKPASYVGETAKRVSKSPDISCDLRELETSVYSKNILMARGTDLFSVVLYWECSAHGTSHRPH